MKAKELMEILSRVPPNAYVNICIKNEYTGPVNSVISEAYPSQTIISLCAEKGEDMVTYKRMLHREADIREIKTKKT